MPVLIWGRDNGSVTSLVRTSRTDNLRGERYRAEAEALDREIDAMLDKAVELADASKITRPHELLLVRRWALGRALHESEILESPNLDSQELSHLWLALARKCRLGIRADGGEETRWQNLIPDRNEDPKRISRDVSVISHWLQQQEPVETVVLTFAGRYGNADKLYLRSALRPLVLREALAEWMRMQPDSIQSELSNGKRYMEIVKALSARFPGRGPGSAKRPVHFPPKELLSEVCKILQPIERGYAKDRIQTTLEKQSPT